MAVQFKSCGSSAALVAEFNKLLADVTAIRTALVAITAKLDADGGVTDTDYNAENPAALTSTGLTN